MTKVDVNSDNLRHCRCPVCPVQKKSSCAQKKNNQEISIEEAKAGDLAKLYCAFGKTTCDDLDYDQGCICSSCLVWDNYDLSSGYYCKNGDAEQNG